jgi:hypothetical protein
MNRGRQTSAKITSQFDTQRGRITMPQVRVDSIDTHACLFDSYMRVDFTRMGLGNQHGYVTNQTNQQAL